MNEKDNTDTDTNTILPLRSGPPRQMWPIVTMPEAEGATTVEMMIISAKIRDG